jgi:hypothetical protein
LFDANNSRIWVTAIILIWALPVACVNKFKGNAIPSFFPFEHHDGQMVGLVILMTRQVGMIKWCLVGTYVGG